jgi:uncharacterized membrane protein
MMSRNLFQTVSKESPVKTLFRAKNVVFGFVAVMTAYVLYHNERFLIQPTNPIWQHYEPFKWWLLPHGLAGACALLLAPMQFSSRLRQRFTKTHRVVGRIYVAGAFILAPLGFYIQYFEERTAGGPRSFTVLAAVDAILLMVTTGIAFRFALKRNIREHRQWMTRSYAVALVFFEGRFFTGITGWDNDPVMTETVIWACLAFSVLIGDLAAHWNEVRSTAVVTPATAPKREAVAT